jgi:hypothetical protein
LSAGFRLAQEEVTQAAKDSTPMIQHSTKQTIPDPRLRLILGLFDRQSTITSADVAAALGLSTRMARVLLAQKVALGKRTPVA